MALFLTTSSKQLAGGGWVERKHFFCRVGPYIPFCTKTGRYVASMFSQTHLEIYLLGKWESKRATAWICSWWLWSFFIRFSMCEFLGLFLENGHWVTDTNTRALCKKQCTPMCSYLNIFIYIVHFKFQELSGRRWVTISHNANCHTLHIVSMHRGIWWPYH